MNVKKQLTDGHRDGAHGRGNAVSVTMLARWGAGGQKAQSGGSFYKLRKCLTNALHI